MQSTCDSEILLRIFENHQQHIHNTRLEAIREIFSLINVGHMAVAIGEKIDEHYSLFLFRNEHRPLWIIDLREILGQVFFVSEPSIWEQSVKSVNIMHYARLIEIPEYEIWHFELKDKLSLRRYYVKKGSERLPWEFSGKQFDISQQPSSYKIVSCLNEDDEINSAKVVFLRWYSFNNELVGEEKLNIKWRGKQPLVASERKWLQELVTHSIDLNVYNYFLETEAHGRI